MARTPKKYAKLEVPKSGDMTNDPMAGNKATKATAGTPPPRKVAVKVSKKKVTKKTK